MSALESRKQKYAKILNKIEIKPKTFYRTCSGMLCYVLGPRRYPNIYPDQIVIRYENYFLFAGTIEELKVLEKKYILEREIPSDLIDVFNINDTNIYKLYFLDNKCSDLKPYVMDFFCDPGTTDKTRELHSNPAPFGFDYYFDLDIKPFDQMSSKFTENLDQLNKEIASILDYGHVHISKVFDEKHLGFPTAIRLSFRNQEDLDIINLMLSKYIRS